MCRWFPLRHSGGRAYAAIMSAADPDCLFCKIIAREIPADIVVETDGALAFRDIAPQAPIHVLVIPKVHQPNAAELARHEPDALVEVFNAAAQVAELEGVADYRSVFNTGAGAGQTVFHAHLHLMAGRGLSWPPG